MAAHEFLESKEGTQYTVALGPGARLTIGVTQIFVVMGEAVNAQLLFIYSNDKTGEFKVKECFASEFVSFLKKTKP
jgi:hypothetical protein